MGVSILLLFTSTGLLYAFPAPASSHPRSNHASIPEAMQTESAAPVLLWNSPRADTPVPHFSDKVDDQFLKIMTDLMVLQERVLETQSVYHGIVNGHHEGHVLAGFIHDAQNHRNKRCPELLEDAARLYCNSTSHSGDCVLPKDAATTKAPNMPYFLNDEIYEQFLYTKIRGLYKVQMAITYDERYRDENATKLASLEAGRLKSWKDLVKILEAYKDPGPGWRGRRNPGGPQRPDPGLFPPRRALEQRAANEDDEPEGQIQRRQQKEEGVDLEEEDTSTTDSELAAQKETFCIRSFVCYSSQDRNAHFTHFSDGKSSDSYGVDEWVVLKELIGVVTALQRSLGELKWRMQESKKPHNYWLYALSGRIIDNENRVIAAVENLSDYKKSADVWNDYQRRCASDPTSCSP